MGFSSIQGWSGPFFGAEFTAAFATVKLKIILTAIERLAKGWAARVAPRTVSTAGRETPRETKNASKRFRRIKTISGVFIMLSIQLLASTPTRHSCPNQTTLACAAAQTELPRL
jgi:hypothetical protein